MHLVSFQGVRSVGAAYRWEADDNAGWVYPPEGMTDSDGHIEAAWIPGSPGSGIMVLTVGEGASTLTVALETQSVAPAHPPFSQTVVWLDHNGRGTGYSIELTPLTEPHGTYYAAIYWDGGYTGLQRGGTLADRQIMFAMWDARSDGRSGPDTRPIGRGQDVICTPFGHQGTGQQCELEYPWQVGTTYRFEVTEEEVDGRTAMTLHITNVATGQRRFVGTLHYGIRANLSWFAMFVEDFLHPAPTCIAQEVRSAAIRRAMVRIDGSWRPITRGLFERVEDIQNPGTPPCANSAARDHASGLEIAIGGRTAMDPDISQVTIPR